MVSYLRLKTKTKNHIVKNWVIDGFRIKTGAQGFLLLLLSHGTAFTIWPCSVGYVINFADFTIFPLWEKIILGGILLSCIVNKQHMHKCIFSFWRSSTYKSQGIDVTVKYSQGSWTGVLGTDVITIPKGIDGSYTINIATIFESENFFLPGVQWHGILGLAYGTLAKVNDLFSCFYHLQWW